MSSLLRKFCLCKCRDQWICTVHWPANPEWLLTTLQVVVITHFQGRHVKCNMSPRRSWGSAIVVCWVYNKIALSTGQISLSIDGKKEGVLWASMKASQKTLKKVSQNCQGQGSRNSHDGGRVSKQAFWTRISGWASLCIGETGYQLLSWWQSSRPVVLSIDAWHHHAQLTSCMGFAYLDQSWKSITNGVHFELYQVWLNHNFLCGYFVHLLIMLAEMFSLLPWQQTQYRCRCDDPLVLLLMECGLIYLGYSRAC